VQSGHVESGEEAFFDLVFPEGAERPETVRAWIGVASGVGSMKGRLGNQGEHELHGHVAVPDPIPDGSAVWFEIEEAGGVQRGSIAWD
jgi:hypothetical protein